MISETDAVCFATNDHNTDPNANRAIPEFVLRAQASAEELGFGYSCTDGFGRLIMTIAASCTGTILELGTGAGVGLAWMSSCAADDMQFISVEQDKHLASSARRLFSDVENVEIVWGTFEAIKDRGPFSMAFIDVADLKDNGQPVIDAMENRGIIVLDDFTPDWLKGTEWRNRADRRKEFWLNHPHLQAIEVLTTSCTSAIIAVRR